MSAVPAPATPTPSPRPSEPTPSSHSWVERMLDYAGQGAALVYHSVLAVQRDVTKWEQSNPAIAALMQKGVSFAAALMTADGLPTNNIFLVAQAVEAALNVLAANDSTVQSGGMAGPSPAQVDPNNV